MKSGMNKPLKIFITGSTGFLGTSLIQYLDAKFVTYTRDTDIVINEEIVIHLAGKAHDTTNTNGAEEYYQINTELTKKVFDAFILSKAKLFIMISSVKAVADNLEESLTEDMIPNPKTHYGKSKFLAEQYILGQELREDKKFYILRPCMIHGPNNKGNLNLLYGIIAKGIPWPLGVYNNRRSFCSIDNFNFIIKEIINRGDLSSGIYNVADDNPLSTNEVVKLMGYSMGKRVLIINIPKLVIKMITCFCGMFNLPLNRERLQKLTQSYVVKNDKVKNNIAKGLPMSSKEGLLKTLDSFKDHDE